MEYSSIGAELSQYRCTGVQNDLLQFTTFALVMFFLHLPLIMGHLKKHCQQQIVVGHTV